MAGNGRLLSAAPKDVLDQHLLEACLFGSVPRARQCIQYGANLNARDPDGWTALHLAAYNGHESVVSLLISFGAEVNSRDPQGYTPLHWAITRNHENVASILLQNRANPNLGNTKQETPIFFCQSRRMANLLVRNSCQLNLRNKDGLSPLMSLVLRCGSQPPTPAMVEVIEFIIRNGAQRSTADPQQGWTALHIAAHNQNARLCALLLELGASAAVRDKIGRTASEVTHNAELQQLLEGAAQQTALMARRLASPPRAVSPVPRSQSVSVMRALSPASSRRSIKTASGVRPRRSLVLTAGDDNEMHLAGAADSAYVAFASQVNSESVKPRTGQSELRRRPTATLPSLGERVQSRHSLRSLAPTRCATPSTPATVPVSQGDSSVTTVAHPAVGGGGFAFADTRSSVAKMDRYSSAVRGGAASHPQPTASQKTHTQQSLTTPALVAFRTTDDAREPHLQELYASVTVRGAFPSHGAQTRHRSPTRASRPGSRAATVSSFAQRSRPQYVVEHSEQGALDWSSLNGSVSGTKLSAAAGRLASVSRTQQRPTSTKSKVSGSNSPTIQSSPVPESGTEPVSSVSPRGLRPKGELSVTFSFEIPS